MTRLESEPQRQQRVAAGIHERIVGRLAMDLPALATDGVVPDEWFPAELLSSALEKSRYWLRHPEPLAAFMSPEQRVRLSGAALALSAGENPAGWWRDGERYRCTLRTDWLATARKTVDRLQAERPHETRIALFRGPDAASVIFSSRDDASTISPEEQLVALRRDLRAAAIPELGFSYSQDAKAWAVLIWAKDDQRLQDALFGAWEAFNGIER